MLVNSKYSGNRVKVLGNLEFYNFVPKQRNEPYDFVYLLLFGPGLGISH